jgi:hypothetical protein
VKKPKPRLRSFKGGKSIFDQPIYFVPFIVIFTALGVFLLNKSHGLSPSISSAAESGVLASGASIANDQNASGGKYVLFGGGLKLTGLDSTIRANWTPSNAASVKWQVISTWTGDGNTANGSKLVGSKVLGPTSAVADMNGLATGAQFTIKLQTMDANGTLSPAIGASTSTVAQAPMQNAAYFDNFDRPDGMMDSSYYDIRTWSGYGDTDQIYDSKTAFTMEHHWHMELIESQGQGGVLVRPRVPASLTNTDGSPHTATMQTEVDMPFSQMAHGKWWEIHLSQDIPKDAFAFGSNGGNELDNSIMFTITGRGGDTNNNRANSYNVADIQVNSNGQSFNFSGNVYNITPANVRVPVVVKVSPTSVSMIINGQTAVNGSGFTLPFNKGWWSFSDTNYRSGFIEQDNPLQGNHFTNDLSHWDMIQYDGPTGSINPVVKTYLQPTCSGFVYIEYHNVHNCPDIIGGGTSASVPLTIPAGDDLSKVNSATITFTGPIPNGVNTTLNGQPLHNFPAHDTGDTMDPLSSYTLTGAQLSLLKNGTNTVGFSTSGVVPYDGLSQVELEVVYNIPRTMPDASQQDFTPRLTATANDIRVDHIKGDTQMVKTGTTYIYSTGANTPINYTIQQLNANANAWFSITSPTSGTVLPVPGGGQLIPVNYSIDFSKFVQPDDQEQGIPAVIKFSGGSMPMYIAVLAVKDWLSSPMQMAGPPVYNQTTFNTSALNL